MGRFGPLVATAAAARTAEVLAAARAARALGADRVEVRLDLLAPGEEPRELWALAAEMPLLVSGRRDAVREEEVPLLREAQARGAWVDVPAEGAPAELLASLDAARLVLSAHTFGPMPADLSAEVGRLRARPAAVHKLVVTASRFADALAVRDLLAGRRGTGLCAFAMGAEGLLTRGLALAWGSEAVYASAPGTAPAAPGQLPLEDLLGWGVRDLGPKTPLFLLLGWPLAFTGTPSFFNEWLREAGRPERYLPCPVEHFGDFWEARASLPLAGLAVTIPHKEAAARRAARLSRLAEACGSTNTLWPSGDGGWLGANTDAHGVRSAVRSLPRRGLRTLILGAGGAAAAAAFALRARGPVALCARDGGRATSLAARAGVETVPWGRRAHATWDLLVNATPLGAEPGEMPLPETALSGRAVLDMVVRREGRTPLLHAARARGLKVIAGEAMLRAQAELQFRIWTGMKVPWTPGI